ncbi:MAG TPA: M6 family metalloprotease domain-containing protein [Gemmatimonadales bacterium]|nr:M6 family metalloprotease domain-containing protein [Gemmatimonadales bacterium]
MNSLGVLARSAVVAVGGLAIAAPARAQHQPVERLRAADGLTLDFPENGVWKARARRVADLRARLRSARRSDQLNRPMLAKTPGAGEAALGGTLRFPTVLVTFSDLSPAQLPSAALYDSIIYTSQPLSGRPYTVRTFYEEMSNGLFTIDGRAHGWFAGDSSTAYYLNACGENRNAVDCGQGRTRMRALFVSALTRMDPGVDFGQFDNDGPDGVPNSGDDDGVVDLVQFIHPVTGGECNGRGFWAHKSSLGSEATSYRTGDTSPGGAAIRVNAYFVASGVGAASCGDGAIMGIGTASHELGHGIGLPDLYDTYGVSEGIGEWGLMGAGGYRSLMSPTHFEAWSKEQLGWVVVRELTEPGSYRLGPVVTSDTVFLVRPTGDNPRGQYFLLENKQPVGSDTANLLRGSQRTGPKIGGLLVWLIDSVKIAQSRPFNVVNSGEIEGVWLVQADGRQDLGIKGNRGDAGDPYPGTTANAALARFTNPFNFIWPGFFAGFGLHRIRQIEPNGAMGFYLASSWIVRTNKPEGVVRVNGVAEPRYWDAPDSGTTHTVTVDTTVKGGMAWQLEFLRWSDGGALTHDVTLGGGDDSLVAHMAARYGIVAAADGPGRIASSPAVQLDPPGTLLAESTTVTLIAVPDTGNEFVAWRGSSASRSDTLRWLMTQPTVLTAVFAPPLELAEAPDLPPAIWGVPYRHPLRAAGGRGAYAFRIREGTLPAGLTLSDSGVVAGTPRQLGVFNATVSVTSGSVGSEQGLVFPVTLRVDAPAVELTAVVGQLFTRDTLVARHAQLYLDFIGNNNSYFDLGDVAALVERTPPGAGMAELQAALEAALQGRRSGSGR